MGKLQIIKAEIDGDPGTYGSMTDAQIATELNAVDKNVNITSMSASQVFNAIDETQWNALLPTDQERIWNVLHMGEVNPFGLEAAIFIDVFGAGTDTITALAAARKTQRSRASIIGLGAVTEQEVTKAKTLS